jgi:cytochrome c peroxidase
MRFSSAVSALARTVTITLLAAAMSPLAAGDLGKFRRHGAPPAGGEDPPEVVLGERLFLETRFAQFFFANSGGDVNASLQVGDPTVETTATPRGPLPGPFAGRSMNCRACHLVDEHGATAGAGNRTYADFARRSPVPAREDGRSVAPRNSPPLVNAALPRRAFLLHFDGEFASTEDLVKETLLGRNFGWLPSERGRAIAHVARVIREDDGLGELAQEFGGAYRAVLKGKGLPKRFRIDVERASDRQVLHAVAKLIAAYVESLLFIQDEDGAFNGSPFDAFLRVNGLPLKPEAGESDIEYSRRLRSLVDGRWRPRWIGPGDGSFALHDQAFVFGPRELEGLVVFLREPQRLPLDGHAVRRGGVGNCIACHAAPNFTDFAFHNTGAAQSEYDAIHGRGAFAALYVPSLGRRNADPQAWLPATPRYPDAPGPFLSVPSKERPGQTDLGLWNVFANPSLPRPQSSIRRLLCDPHGRCSAERLLEKSVARFKTPGLRDLGHSGPYLHTGRADTIEEVLGLYVQFSGLVRAGQMRNAAPELKGMALTAADVAALAAFLRALNEDYE